MSLAKATVEIPSRSGLPEDVTVNSFFFDVADGGPTTAEKANIVAALTEFYTAVPTTPAVTGSGAWSSLFMGSSLMPQPTTATVKIYTAVVDPGDADTRPHFTVGSPEHTATFSMGSGSAEPSLPEEVAICLSFHGTLSAVEERIPLGPSGPAGDERPRARRRGRIYLGRLSTNTLSVANGRTTVSTLARDTLASLAKRLADRSDVSWVVASATGNHWVPVIGGWVDNSFDTQRRRGPVTSARTTWVAA